MCADHHRSYDRWAWETYGTGWQLCQKKKNRNKKDCACQIPNKNLMSDVLSVDEICVSYQWAKFEHRTCKASDTICQNKIEWIAREPFFFCPERWSCNQIFVITFCLWMWFFFLLLCFYSVKQRTWCRANQSKNMNHFWGLAVWKQKIGKLLEKTERNHRVANFHIVSPIIMNKRLDWMKWSIMRFHC